MSFLTCFWLFPQNEHFSRSPPSPNLATTPPPDRHWFEPDAWASGSAHACRHADSCELTVGDHLVDDPVLLRLRGTHDEVAVGVAAHLLDLLPGVVGEDLVEGLAHAHDLLGLDLDVDRLARRTTVRLVDQHAGVREDVALAGGPRGEDHGRGRRRLPEADGRHVGLDELHRVVDGEETGDLAAGRVDVDRDVLVGLLALEVEELRDHDVRHDIVDGRAEEDDPVLQQPGEDVVAVGAAGRVLGDVGDVDVLEVAHDAGSSSAAAGSSGTVAPSDWDSSTTGPSPSAPSDASDSESGGCGSDRSTVLPSASTTSAWSIRNASALPRAMSERTASITPRRSRSLRTFAGFSSICCAMRSTSASTSSSVAAISS